MMRFPDFQGDFSWDGGAKFNIYIFWLFKASKEGTESERSRLPTDIVPMLLCLDFMSVDWIE